MANTVSSLLSSLTNFAGYDNIDKRNSNLADLNLTDAQIEEMRKHPWNFLLGAKSADLTKLLAAGASVYQPLDGYTVGTSFQTDGRQSRRDAAALGKTTPIYPKGFLTVDDDPNSALKPPSLVKPEDFSSWTTGQQKEYIYRYLTDNNNANNGGVAYDKRGAVLTIGGLSVVLGPGIDDKGAKINENQVRIIIVNNLTKTTIAKLTTDEQRLVASSDYFRGYIAAAFGLTINPDLVPNTPPSLASHAIDQKDTGLNAYLAQIYLKLKDSGVEVTIDGAGNVTGVLPKSDINTKNDGRRLTGEAVQVFLDQIERIRAQYNATPIVSDADVQKKVAAVFDRFKQVYYFGTVPNVTSTNTVFRNYFFDYNSMTGGNINVVSTDPTSGTTTTDGPKVYFYRLERHDVQDKNRLPVSALITPWDVKEKHGQTNSLMERLGSKYVFKKTEWDTDDPHPFYIKDAKGNLVNLNAGSIVQVDAQGRLVGSLYDSNGTPIEERDLLGGDANDPPKNASDLDRANQRIFSSDPSIPVLGLPSGDQGFYQSRFEDVRSNNGKYVGTGVKPYNALNSVPGYQATGNNVMIEVQTFVTAPTSTSNQTTISGGYDKLLVAAKKVKELGRQMDDIAKSVQTTASDGTNKSLDVPSLIFFMQLFTNLITEQQVAASTEIVNQQNALLNTYSQMQRLVNAVQGTFTADKNTEERDIFGNLYMEQKNGNDTSAVTFRNLTPGDLASVGANGQPIKRPSNPSDINIITMFDTASKARGTALNPIESLFGITRPDYGMIDLGSDGVSGSGYMRARTSTSWNSFGTSLSSAVTQINQQTQILMNDINSLDKQKTQHFDLANNCLSKMNDILASIGRNAG